jgi:hypothetical protein
MESVEYVTHLVANLVHHQATHVLSRECCLATAMHVTIRYVSAKLKGGSPGCYNIFVYY